VLSRNVPHVKGVFMYVCESLHLQNFPCKTDDGGYTNKSHLYLLYTCQSENCIPEGNHTKWTLSSGSEQKIYIITWAATLTLVSNQVHYNIQYQRQQRILLQETSRIGTDLPSCGNNLLLAFSAVCYAELRCSRQHWVFTADNTGYMW